MADKDKKKDADAKKEDQKASNSGRDESSSSEDEEEVVIEEIKADRVGYMELKVKDKWRAVHCVLIKGSLFYYKDAKDQEPTGVVHLKRATLVETPDVGDKKFALQLNTSEGDDKNSYTAALGSQLEYSDWIAALKKNKDLDESEAPQRVKRKKESVLNRAKKKMAGSAATSHLGKRVVKSIINEETTSLLSAMKRIVKKESSQKKADEFEKNIIKIAVKSYLLIENKKLTGDDFLEVDAPLRESFELMIKCFNARGRVQQQVVLDALKKVEAAIKKAENILTGLLSPHLTNKNMFRLTQTFGYLGNAEFLSKVFNDPALEGEVEKLVDAMEYYTQFHYHK